MHTRIQKCCSRETQKKNKKRDFCLEFGEKFGRLQPWTRKILLGRYQYRCQHIDQHNQSGDRSNSTRCTVFHWGSQLWAIVYNYDRRPWRRISILFGQLTIDRCIKKNQWDSIYKKNSVWFLVPTGMGWITIKFPGQQNRQKTFGGNRKKKKWKKTVLWRSNNGANQIKKTSRCWTGPLQEQWKVSMIHMWSFKRSTEAPENKILKGKIRQILGYREISSGVVCRRWNV